VRAGVSQQDGEGSRERSDRPQGGTVRASEASERVTTGPGLAHLLVRLYTGCQVLASTSGGGVRERSEAVRERSERVCVMM
jgi:hypothetical protein